MLQYVSTLPSEARSMLKMLRRNRIPITALSAFLAGISVSYFMEKAEFGRPLVAGEIAAEEITKYGSPGR